MTEPEMERVAKLAAKEAVQETFVRLGIDPNKPFEAQQDMQFLRSVRKSSETIKKQGIVTTVGIMTAGILAALWVTLKGPFQ